MMDVWECDLMDMPYVIKYNDKYKYLLSVIDVFLKYLHIVPLRAKTCAARELCISFDSREVFETNTQTSRLGANG